MAACSRRDASRALLEMRCFLSAVSTAWSGKAAASGFRAMERALESLATRPSEPLPAAERAKTLAKFARKSGAKMG